MDSRDKQNESMEWLKIAKNRILLIYSLKVISLNIFLNFIITIIKLINLLFHYFIDRYIKTQLSKAKDKA